MIEHRLNALISQISFRDSSAWYRAICELALSNSFNEPATDLCLSRDIITSRPVMCEVLGVDDCLLVVEGKWMLVRVHCSIPASIARLAVTLSK
jgi:hypothetical protein